jgi:hypothetical protein
VTDGKPGTTRFAKQEVKSLKLEGLLLSGPHAANRRLPMPNAGTHLVRCETAVPTKSTHLLASRSPQRTVRQAASRYTLIAFCVTASAVLLKGRPGFIPQ